jgi:hypothetical protein
MSTQTLIVTVIKANLNKDVVLLGSMDPYFLAKINGTILYKSSERSYEGKFPLWNEKFTFNYDKQQYLTLEIYHSKKLVNNKDFI